MGEVASVSMPLGTENLLPPALMEDGMYAHVAGEMEKGPMVNVPVPDMPIVGSMPSNS